MAPPSQELEPPANPARFRQKASGYTKRARAEAAIARWKRVIGDALRSRKDKCRAAEVAVAAHALNRMLALGRPSHGRAT